MPEVPGDRPSRAADPGHWEMGGRYAEKLCGGREDRKTGVWPVRFMDLHRAELYERAARAHGSGFAALQAFTDAAWPNENCHTRSLALALGAWHVHGRQSFACRRSWSRALRDTSLKSVPAEALRSPIRRSGSRRSGS